MTDTPIDVLSARDGYDRWAEIYDDEDNPLIALEEPHVDRCLGDVRGLDVIDLGCGTGRHTSRLLRAGGRVVALEYSLGMLARARERPELAAARFMVHDLTQPLPLADATFDRVVCGLVLEHIAALPPLFAEMRRVCRPTGRIVVSTLHPAMMLRGISARFTDPRTGRETRPASHNHSVSDVVMAALRAGLTLDECSEHAVDAALAARSPRAVKYIDWPMLLLLSLRPGATAATRS